MSQPRLRERPLTAKPRVVKSNVGDHYWTEYRDTDGHAYCTVSYTFPDAIARANEISAKKAGTQ